jgi:hypothetical protein
MKSVQRETRKLKPAHGIARWLVRPEAGWQTSGRLEIATERQRETYTVEAIHTGGPETQFAGLAGFRLTNETSGDVYDIDTTQLSGWTCDCPDGQYRAAHATSPEARHCKHVLALQAALACKSTPAVPELFYGPCLACGAVTTLANGWCDLCSLERNEWGDALNAQANTRDGREPAPSRRACP